MGIVKIDDDLHGEIRRASAVMCRSINAQAEFWMKIGMLAEANPALSFNEIVKMQFAAAHLRVAVTATGVEVLTLRGDETRMAERRA